MFEFDCCNCSARLKRWGLLTLCAGVCILVALACKPTAKADDKAVDAKPAAAGAAAGAPASDGKAFTQMIPGSKISFKMVPIPGGKFAMGSPVSEKKRQEGEGPQFTVEVEPFWMGECEVTQAEYDLYLENYQRLAEKGAPSIPKDKLADAVTYPTPMYEKNSPP